MKAFTFTEHNLFNYLKLNFMGNLLYIIAVILIIGWLIGFIGYHAGGGLIHLLLVIAVIAIVLNVIQGRKSI